jgi:ribosomal 30S subunit maturation factor RimM
MDVLSNTSILYELTRNLGLGRILSCHVSGHLQVYSISSNTKIIASYESQHLQVTSPEPTYLEDLRS